MDLRSHLNSNLGSHRHQSLRLVEDRGSDDLAGSGNVQTTLLLDGGVLVPLVVGHHQHHQLGLGGEHLVQGGQVGGGPGVGHLEHLGRLDDHPQ